MAENNTVNDNLKQKPTEIPGHPIFAVIGGLGAGLLCAVIWATITVLTKYQVGFMALGAGALVGLSVRYFGEGSNILFGIIGAVIALLSCLLGNLLSQIAFYSIEESINIFEVIVTLNYSLIPQILAESVQPMDFLFYGIAVFEGFRFSIIKRASVVSAEDADQALQTQYPRIKLGLLFLIFIILTGTGIGVFLSSNRTQTYYYPSGKMQARGKLSGGQAEGIWTYWYENGNVQAEISFENNRKAGLSIFYNEKGVLISEETYEKGLLHGPATVYNENGQVTSEAYYQYDRLHGLFKTYGDNNDLISRGNYKRDRQDGTWEYWYQNGNKEQSGDYDNGNQIGLWEYWYENGKKMQQIEYKEDEELLLNYWDSNGRLIIENGNGLLSTFYDNGQVSSRGKVKNGRKIEKWKKWHENGKLNEESLYINNKSSLVNYWNEDGHQLVKDGNGTIILFYPDGKKMIEIPYVDGYMNGKYKMWHDDGNIFVETIYRNSLADGESINYYRNKTRSARGNFKKGKMDGRWQWWNEDGTLSSEVTFVNGNKEGKQEFWVNEIKTKVEEYKNNELISTKVF